MHVLKLSCSCITFLVTIIIVLLYKSLPLWGVLNHYSSYFHPLLPSLSLSPPPSFLLAPGFAECAHPYPDTLRHESRPQGKDNNPETSQSDLSRKQNIKVSAECSVYYTCTYC